MEVEEEGEDNVLELLVTRSEGITHVVYQLVVDNLVPQLQTEDYEIIILL